MTLARPDDQDIIVFGATGDLAARKLLPALYNLSVEGLVPSKGKVICAAPVASTLEAFVAHTRASVKANSRTGIDEAAFSKFSKRLDYVDISKGLAPLHKASQSKRRLAYLAVPASAFASLISAIGKADLAEGTSIIIEKPFGHDRASARKLNDVLHTVVSEDRIFRIDHYLGKETVQNLIVFRFGNSIFERVWNREAISRVEITVAESLGVEQRGAFYEETGAIRDIVQNHLLQVLSIVAMEPASSFDPEALRNEKVKLLQAVRVVKPEEVVLGQYDKGKVDGESVVGYRQEPGVSPKSNTETFAALRLHIDNWRWSKVPFIVRTGKRLAQRDTRVVVVFKDVPLNLFGGTGVHRVDNDRLIVRLQPDEGISLTFVAKKPGADLQIQNVRMDFSYASSFKTSPPEAYERLLHDAMRADHTLFIREDEVDRGWQIVEPILNNPPPLHRYAAGSWGPREQQKLAEPLHWHDPDDQGH